MNEVNWAGEYYLRQEQLTITTASRGQDRCECVAEVQYVLEPDSVDARTKDLERSASVKNLVQELFEGQIELVDGMGTCRRVLFPRGRWPVVLGLVAQVHRVTDRHRYEVMPSLDSVFEQTLARIELPEE